MNVAADRKTLFSDDHRQLFELLKHRHPQCCLFLSALLGEKQMD
jgi:hypothetical protein